MKMRVNAVLFLLFIAFNGWAQMPEMSPDESAKKKEINSIKLEGDAFYSDRYHEVPVDEAAMEEAHKRSKELLQAHVIEIFSKRLKMSKEDVQDIWEIIEKNSKNIIVKRGDMFRLFTYVMKNAFGMGDNGEITVPAPESKIDSVKVNLPEPKPESESKPEPKPESKPEPKPESKPEPKPESKPEPKPEPKPGPVVEIQIPALCQTLMNKGNFEAVFRYLKEEMAYQRLIFGSEKRMQYPERCYIVLTDKESGAIVAILDKGQSERMNFMTKKMDHFRNYVGGNNKAIFVQEY